MATDAIVPSSHRRTGHRRSSALTRYLSAFRTPRGATALALLAVLLLAAVLVPVIVPGGYDQQSALTLSGPSAQHPFGTDELGRDILIRSIYGLRTDVSLIFAAIPLSMVVGTLLGLSGVLAPWLGTGAQRLLDIILGFPNLIMGMTVVLVLGTGWLSLFLAITIAGLPAFGRLARNGFLAEREREYVLAARVLGVRRSVILRRHILPNIIDPILVQASIFMVIGIFIEAGLSIVGLGINPPAPSLGAMLNTGARYADVQSAYILGPGIILFLLALAFTLLADALNRAVIRR